MGYTEKEEWQIAENYVRKPNYPVAYLPAGVRQKVEELRGAGVESWDKISERQKAYNQEQKAYNQEKVGYYYDIDTGQVYTKSETKAEPFTKYEGFKVATPNEPRPPVDTGYYYELTDDGAGAVYSKSETKAGEFQKYEGELKLKPETIRPNTNLYQIESQKYLKKYMSLAPVWAKEGTLKEKIKPPQYTKSTAEELGVKYYGFLSPQYIRRSFNKLGEKTYGLGEFTTEKLSKINSAGYVFFIPKEERRKVTYGKVGIPVGSKYWGGAIGSLYLFGVASPVMKTTTTIQKEVAVQLKQMQKGHFAITEQTKEIGKGRIKQEIKIGKEIIKINTKETGTKVYQTPVTRYYITKEGEVFPIKREVYYFVEKGKLAGTSKGMYGGRYFQGYKTESLVGTGRYKPTEFYSGITAERVIGKQIQYRTDLFIRNQGGLTKQTILGREIIGKQQTTPFFSYGKTKGEIRLFNTEVIKYDDLFSKGKPIKRFNYPTALEPEILKEKPFKISEWVKAKPISKTETASLLELKYSKLKVGDYGLTKDIKFIELGKGQAYPIKPKITKKTGGGFEWIARPLKETKKEKIINLGNVGGGGRATTLEEMYILYPPKTSQGFFSTIPYVTPAQQKLTIQAGYKGLIIPSSYGITKITPIQDTQKEGLNIPLNKNLFEINVRTELKPKQREILKPSLEIPHKTGLDLKQEEKLIQNITPRTEQKVTTKLSSQTRQDTKQKTKLIQVNTLRTPAPQTPKDSYFNTPPKNPPPIFPFKFPSLGLDLGISKRKLGVRPPKYKYTPSYRALVFQVRGVKTKGIETGFKFRPITKRFKFINV